MPVIRLKCHKVKRESERGRGKKKDFQNILHTQNIKSYLASF